jgi:hypothetical protein
MNNEPTRRRPPLLRGAMEGGCAAWTPILPTGKAAASGKAAAATEPLAPPDNVSEADRTPASASDAEP